MAALPAKEEVKEDGKEEDAIDEEKLKDEVKEVTPSVATKAGQGQGKTSGGGKKKKGKR